jgi:hypothetical protein
MAGDRAGALAHINDDEILSRIQAGELIIDIAKSLGVAHSAISMRYADNPAYKFARETGVDTRLQDAEKEMEGAQDPLTLARARERFRAIAWRAEREFPHRWGQTKHLVVEQVGDLGERLRRALERDVSPIPVSLPTQAIDSTSTVES